MLQVKSFLQMMAFPFNYFRDFKVDSSDLPSERGAAFPEQEKHAKGFVCQIGYETCVVLSMFVISIYPSIYLSTYIYIYTGTSSRFHLPGAAFAPLRCRGERRGPRRLDGADLRGTRGARGDRGVPWCHRGLSW